MKKAGILAAGKGTRLQSINAFKPIVKINGTPLLELTFKNLALDQFQKIAIIFNDDEKNMNLSLLPTIHETNINYFFKTTESSMHSLYEVLKKLEPKTGEHVFISMVDSIVLPKDAKNFHHFCENIKESESAILVTNFIDDENPLTLKINEQFYITDFQCPFDEEVLITSVVYYFSENIMPLLEQMINEGHTKMRNFLAELIKRNYKIKAFVSPKTLDIDHPKDISVAELFLKENQHAEN